MVHLSLVALFVLTTRRLALLAITILLVGVAALIEDVVVVVVLTVEVVVEVAVEVVLTAGDAEAAVVDVEAQLTAEALATFKVRRCRYLEKAVGILTDKS